MVNVINFNKARKAKAHADKQARAHTNRIVHGTPKAQREAASRNTASRDKKLKAHKRADTPDGQTTITD